MAEEQKQEKELLRDILTRMEGKIDTAAENAVLAKQAAQLLADKVDDHIAQDRLMHKQIDGRLSPLEHFRTKAMAYLAIVGIVVTVVVGAAKDALASIFTSHIPH